MKGGVLVSNSKQSTQYFYNYLFQSNFNMLSYNYVNLVLEAKYYGNNYDMLYKKINPSNDYGTPVKNVVFKFVRIHDNESYESFKNEINTQVEIYLKTLNYLQPLCPAIAYSEVIHKDNNDEIQQIKDIILEKNSNSEFDWVMHDFFDVLEVRGAHLGIILMEIPDNFELYNSIIADEAKDSFKYGFIAMYAVLQLALQTQYVHGDFHSRNLLFLKTNDYFSDLNLRPMFLDFGDSFKLSLTDYQEVQNLYEDKKYYDCVVKIRSKGLEADLSFLNSDAEKDSFEIENPGKTLEEVFNNFYKNLTEQRITAIDSNVESMKTLHKTNKDYPLLPVSNTIRNKLYPGVLEGGTQSKKKRRKTRKNKRQINKSNRRKNIYK